MYTIKSKSFSLVFTFLAFSLLCVALSFISGKSYAQNLEQAFYGFEDNDSEFYFGARVAYTMLTIKQKYQHTDDTIGTLRNFSMQSNPISAGLQAGFRYNAYVGGEVNLYLPLATPMSSFSLPSFSPDLEPVNAGSNFKSTETDGIVATRQNAVFPYDLSYSASFVARYPLTSEFSIFAKIGVGGVAIGSEKVAFSEAVNGQTSVETSGITTITINQGMSSFGLSFGGGVRWRISPFFSAMAEYEQTVLGSAGGENISSATMGNIIGGVSLYL